MAIMASKGVSNASGAAAAAVVVLVVEEEEGGLLLVAERVEVGFVRSVRDVVEESRSVTAEVAVEGMLDAWCCEAA